MSAIPVPYVGTGSQSQTVLGHYAAAQVSGAIAATPAAGDVHASFRWAPSVPNALAVLMRIRVGWSIISAVTTSVEMAYQAQVARGFTGDFSSGNTQLNLAGTSAGKTNSMRTSMGGSLLTTKGPQVCTTTGMTGQTFTLDVAPFAVVVWPALVSVTATGTAVAQQAGTAGAMTDLYQWTALGGHPVVLANNEGVVVRLTKTGWATGTVSFYCQWEWAEVLVF